MAFETSLSISFWENIHIYIYMSAYIYICMYTLI